MVNKVRENDAGRLGLYEGEDDSRRSTMADFSQDCHDGFNFAVVLTVARVAAEGGSEYAQP